MFIVEIAMFFLYKRDNLILSRQIVFESKSNRMIFDGQRSIVSFKHLNIFVVAMMANILRWKQNFE